MWLVAVVLPILRNFRIYFIAIELKFSKLCHTLESELDMKMNVQYLACTVSHKVGEEDTVYFQPFIDVIATYSQTSSEQNAI